MAANDETLGPEEHVVIQPQIQQPIYGTRGNTVDFEIQPCPTTDQATPTSTQTGNSPRSPDAKAKPGLKRVKSFYTPYMEDKLCRELKFFFMSPDEKIKARKRCPWKLLVQIFKIIFVTIQLIQFGYSRSSFVEFTSSTLRTMQHLYLRDWSNSYETMPYPPAIGKYALYKIDVIEDHFNYALKAYDQTRDIALGSLRYFLFPNGTKHPMKLCLEQYMSGTINDTDNTYNIDSTVTHECYNVGALENGTYNITEYLLQKYNLAIDYDRLLIARLKFSLKSFRLDVNERNFPPQLYRVDVTLIFDDGNKDGQMLISVTTDLTEIEIDGHSTNEDAEKARRAGTIVLDAFVLVFTALSILLCSRSVWRAQRLRKKTMHFFKHRYGKDLSTSDQCEFLNLWYVTIIINDILTVVGTGYKIELETRNLKSSSSNYDVAGLMLGTGSLLAWLGILRYIGFFRQFNVLIVTLKKAFPRIMQFLVCCFLLYMGFVVCGWVVLGPYHLKFREMGRTSECLFALINGDDIFGTFAGLEKSSELVWYYSRLYLYSFSALFIYAVLNLFIAVILDSYETIKKYYTHGFPKTELFEFIDKCKDPAHSEIFRKEKRKESICNICCCTCESDDLEDSVALT